MGRDIRLLRWLELALYWRMLQLPRVIGHRGAAAYAPENTLASFREARKRGARWVETDVKLTQDGVPIVMHDESLKRTTGVDRLVARTPNDRQTMFFSATLDGMAGKVARDYTHEPRRHVHAPEAEKGLRIEHRFVGVSSPGGPTTLPPGVSGVLM